MLVNQACVSNNGAAFWLAGVTIRWSDWRISHCAGRIGDNEFKLLLAHNPLSCAAPLKGEIGLKRPHTRRTG